MNKESIVRKLKQIIKNKGNCDQDCDDCPLQKETFRNFRYECGYVDMDMDAFLRGEPADRVPDYIVEEATLALTKIGGIEDILEILL